MSQMKNKKTTSVRCFKNFNVVQEFLKRILSTSDCLDVHIIMQCWCVPLSLLKSTDI